MTGLLIVVCALTLAFSAGLFLHNLFRRTYDPVSLRNLFLLGYVYFFCLGTLLLLQGLDGGWFRLDSGYLPTPSGYLKFALLMPVFLGVFLLMSHIGLRWSSATKLIPRVDIDVTTPTLWAAIVPLLAISAGFSVFELAGFVGLLGAQLASGAGAAAFGLALYYALARKLNPLAWGLAGLTLLVGIVSATVGGSGRRFLLGLLLVGPWVLYFAKMRYMRPVRLMVPVGVGAGVALVLVLMYSSVRGESERDAGARLRQIAGVLTNPSVTMNTLYFTLYTDTTYNTLFILENYPDQFEHHPLHGAYWFFANPIPRVFWPGKPAALGETLQGQMSTAANLGPGIIGHGWYEAGLIGVLYYAVFFGLLLGVLDRSLAERAANPFFVVMLGSNLGNWIAMPRGDTPLFFIQWVASVVVVFVVLVVVKLFVSPISRAFTSLRIRPPALLDPGAVAHQGDSDECVLWSADGDVGDGDGVGGFSGIGYESCGAAGLVDRAVKSE